MNIDTELVAIRVLHHIDTMYPKLWETVPKNARYSVRNTLQRELEQAIKAAIADQLANT